VLEYREVGETVIFGDADVVGEGTQSTGCDTAAAQSGDRGQPRVVPSGNEPFFNKLHELALAQHGIAEIQARELVLVR
jgi:hypothetical protein